MHPKAKEFMKNFRQLSRQDQELFYKIMLAERRVHHGQAIRGDKALLAKIDRIYGTHFAPKNKARPS